MKQKLDQLKAKGLQETTYKLRVRMDPAECHQPFGDLALEKLYLVIHRAHVLLARLCWHNYSSHNQLSVFFLSC